MASGSSGQAKTPRKVVIFTQPGWMFCNRTKEFLSQHGVGFEERNVTSDESALEELQTRGLMTTPVTFIDGDTVVGFDRARLTKLLGLGCWLWMR